MGVFCSQVGQMGGRLVRSENCRKKQKMKVIRMKFSILEIVPTSNDSIFKLSPASQLPHGAKIKKTYGRSGAILY